MTVPQLQQLKTAKAEKLAAFKASGFKSGSVEVKAMQKRVEDALSNEIVDIETEIKNRS